MNPRPSPFRVAALALALLSSVNCSVKKGNYRNDMQVAENAVADFHQLFEAEAFEQIAAATDPSIEVPGGKTFVQYLRDARTTYGALVETGKKGSGSFPHQARLVYHSTYQRGDATEVFAWAIVDRRATLLFFGIYPGHISPSASK